MQDHTPPMPARADSLFILADDLSGAADCAAGAAKAGLKSIVLLDPAAAQDAQVVAVDSDARHRTAQEAQAINRALWRSHAAPGRLFYKKIDSTLRGNVAAEIAALAEAGVAIIAPAFPPAGRTTRAGRVFVQDVPLEATETWRDEKMRGAADIVAMLAGAGVKAINVPLRTVRAGLREELVRLTGSGQVNAIVCDAQEERDLAAIAAASFDLPVWWVGSAGLVAHLPRAAGLVGSTADPAPAVHGPIVTVVGSLSTVSRRQAQQLEAGADLAVFVAAPQLLRAGQRDPAWQALRAQVGQALQAGRDVLIRIGLAERNDLAQGHELCESLGRLLGPLAPLIGALVATGGETARALLPAFGAHALQLLREIEPGVPLSLALGGRPIPVITKAGAFGSPAALLNCYRTLAAMRGGAPASEGHSTWTAH